MDTSAQSYEVHKAITAWRNSYENVVLMLYDYLTARGWTFPRTNYKSVPYCRGHVRKPVPKSEVNERQNVMNNHNHVGGYDITQNEIPTQEINPNNYIYYVIENRHNNEIENYKNINLNEFVDPTAKMMIDKYLHDLFAKKPRGRPYSRTTNVTRKQPYSTEFSCNGGILKNMVHKSVQTERLINICTHKTITNKSAFENHIGVMSNVKYNNKEIVSVHGKGAKNVANNFHRDSDRLLLSSHQLLSAKNASALHSNSVNDIEDKNRKKLHVTKIGIGNKSNNTPIYINKSFSNSSTINNNSSNDLRYINIKCSTKLQHIPINVQSLNSNHAKNNTAHLRHNSNNASNVQLQNQNANSNYACTTAVSTATNSFTYSSFSRNGNNLITKAQSSYASPLTSAKRIQLQELKTYSRKASDNNNCYLLNTLPSSSTVLEQKYFVNHSGTTDKFQKVQHGNSVQPKVNVNAGDIYSIVSSCSPPKTHHDSGVNTKFPIPNVSACANNIVTVSENASSECIGTQIAGVISARTTNSSNSIGESMSIKVVTSYNSNGCKDGSNGKHELQNSHNVIFANKHSPTSYVEYNSILQTTGGGL